jgi:hypothetical protein
MWGEAFRRVEFRGKRRKRTESAHADQEGEDFPIVLHVDSRIGGHLLDQMAGGEIRQHLRMWLGTEKIGVFVLQLSHELVSASIADGCIEVVGLPIGL